MTEHYIYIDVPYSFELDWNLIPKSQQQHAMAAEHVMTVVTGYPTKFIYNSGAELSEGDLYKVILNSKEEETFCLLKTGFKLVNKQVVDDYLIKEHTKRIMNYDKNYGSPRC